jgi:hypothetical protein
MTSTRLRYALLSVEQDANADADEHARVVHASHGFITLDAEGRRCKASAEKAMRDAMGQHTAGSSHERSPSPRSVPVASRSARTRLHLERPADSLVPPCRSPPSGRRTAASRVRATNPWAILPDPGHTAPLQMARTTIGVRDTGAYSTRGAGKGGLLR